VNARSSSRANRRGLRLQSLAPAEQPCVRNARLARLRADALLAFIPSEVCQPRRTDRSPPLMWLPRVNVRTEVETPALGSRLRPKPRTTASGPLQGVDAAEPGSSYVSSSNLLEVCHLPALEPPSALQNARSLAPPEGGLKEDPSVTVGESPGPTEVNRLLIAG
jgi:hypothetical protein